MPLADGRRNESDRRTLFAGAKQVKQVKDNVKRLDCEARRLRDILEETEETRQHLVDSNKPQELAPVPARAFRLGMGRTFAGRSIQSPVLHASDGTFHSASERYIRESNSPQAPHGDTYSCGPPACTAGTATDYYPSVPSRLMCVFVRSRQPAHRPPSPDSSTLSIMREPPVSSRLYANFERSSKPVIPTIAKRFL